MTGSDWILHNPFLGPLAYVGVAVFAVCGMVVAILFQLFFAVVALLVGIIFGVGRALESVFDRHS
jgi:hypothetical protein